MTIKTSMLTCPNCGFEETLKMPSDSCVIFHTCSNCRTILKPKKGDCCVFCSYGTVRCPSKQSSEF